MIKSDRFSLQRGIKELLTSWVAALPVSHQWLQCCKQAHQNKQIAFDESPVKAINLTSGSTYKAMQQLMQRALPPVAISTFKNYIRLDDHKQAASVDENSLELDF